MKVISIHQPHYHPWIGLLDKIANSDKHVVLDDVQYRKRNFQNRAIYSSPTGSKLLTIPVLSKGHQENSLLISEVLLAPQDLEKQFLTLRHSYRKTEGWSLIEDQLHEIYVKPHTTLLDLNLKLLKLAMNVFHIDTPIVLSSSLNTLGYKNEKLIEICKRTNATHYLSGNGAKKYMDELKFLRNNIQVRFQDFQHPVYKQGTITSFQSGCFGLEWFFFEPNKSISYFEQVIANKSSFTQNYPHPNSQKISSRC